LDIVYGSVCCPPWPQSIKSDTNDLFEPFLAQFYKLFGRTTDNKNDVVKQGSWYFTGNRNERYKFKGLGARGL